MTNAAPLLNIPRSAEEWDQWGFQLDQNVRDITQALRLQKNVILPEQQLYPIPPNALGEWLERMSGVIGEICGELEIQAADIENVNIEDERERQAWVWTVYQEINAARGVLKI